MSALEVLLRNFFEQCSNAAGVIDSSLRWRKFCTKLNAAGVLCSEADRAALARLWTQHTASRGAHLGALGPGTRGGVGDGNSSSLAATPDLSFPTLRRLLEQAFAPRWRADVERGLERAAAVAKVWAAEPAAMPADMSEGNLRTLAAQYEEALARVSALRSASAAALHLDDVGLAQLNAQQARRPHCRRFQEARAEDIRRQVRIQQVPLHRIATGVLRGKGIRSAGGGGDDVFGLLACGGAIAAAAVPGGGAGFFSGAGARAHRGGFFFDPTAAAGWTGAAAPPPPSSSLSTNGGRVVPVERGDDLFQIVQVRLSAAGAFRSAANCYLAHRQLTFSAHALRCCGESDTAVPGSAVFAYSGHADPVRVAAVAEKVGRFDESDHVFRKIAAALLGAVRDVHAMSTFHLTAPLTLDNFVLVGDGQHLLLADVPWGDSCDRLDQDEHYQAFCTRRDQLLLRSVVGCLRRLLGLSMRVRRNVRVRSKDAAFRVTCGDTLCATLPLPKRWLLGRRRAHTDGGGEGDDGEWGGEEGDALEMAVEYAGTVEGKHCARFLRCYRPRVAGRGRGTAAAAELRLEFSARAVGRSVWRVRPVGNRFHDYVTISLAVVSRAKLSAFEDFADVAAHCGGDFDRAWNHDYLQGILAQRPPL